MKRFLSTRVLLGLGASTLLLFTAITAIVTLGFFKTEDALAMPTALRIEARPIVWNPENPQDRTAGKLTYVGGLELSSEDARFGGLSALLMAPTGDALIAISDRGNWLTADLISEDHKPVALANATIAPILSPEGIPLSGKHESDSEGLAGPTGQDPRSAPLLVSFERHHRLLKYDLNSKGLETPGQAVPDFEAFNAYGNNRGLEAITYLKDGSLLAISEGTLDADGYIVGSRLTPTSATPIRLRQNKPFMLTDIATLPGGDLITLERHYSPIAGVSLSLRRIPATALQNDQPLDGEILLQTNNSRSIDNMEGLSIRIAKDGTPLLYLISDDNFNVLQRTLLLVFALNE